MTTAAVIIAVLGTLLAAALTAAEAAINRMSRVRAEELAAEGRVGASSLSTIMADPAPHLATLAFLRATGRAETDVARTEAVARALRLFRDPGDPLPGYDATLEIDLSRIEPAMAGPRRPEQRVALSDVASTFSFALARPVDVAVGDDDPAALGGQLARAGPADSRGAADDHGDPLPAHALSAS